MMFDPEMNNLELGLEWGSSDLLFADELLNVPIHHEQECFETGIDIGDILKEEENVLDNSHEDVLGKIITDLKLPEDVEMDEGELVTAGIGVTEGEEELLLYINFILKYLLLFQTLSSSRLPRRTNSFFPTPEMASLTTWQQPTTTPNRCLLRRQTTAAAATMMTPLRP